MKDKRNILVLDTSGARLAIAMCYGGKIYKTEGETAAKKHLETVLPLLDELLASVGARLADMDYFGAVTGPGSFTGVRIGVTLVNSFKTALKKPVFGLTAFDVLAAEKKYKKAIYLVDAMHDNFYAGIYLNKNWEYKNLTREEIVAYKCNTVLRDDRRVSATALIRAARTAIDSAQNQSLAPFYMKASSAEREAKN